MEVHTLCSPINTDYNPNVNIKPLQVDGILNSNMLLLLKIMVTKCDVIMTSLVLYSRFRGIRSFAVLFVFFYIKTFLSKSPEISEP